MVSEYDCVPSVLNWFESKRVRRMTPAQRTRWHEYGHVNEIQLQLKRDHAANRISEKEYWHRFKKEVVDVRKKLQKEHNEEHEAHGILRQDGPVEGDTTYSVRVIAKSGKGLHIFTSENDILPFTNEKAADKSRLPWQKHGF